MLLFHTFNIFIWQISLPLCSLLIHCTSQCHCFLWRKFSLNLFLYLFLDVVVGWDFFFLFTLDAKVIGSRSEFWGPRVLEPSCEILIFRFFISDIYRIICGLLLLVLLREYDLWVWYYKTEESLNFEQNIESTIKIIINLRDWWQLLHHWKICHFPNKNVREDGKVKIIDKLM